jgi:hypothetical protein
LSWNFINEANEPIVYVAVSGGAGYKNALQVLDFNFPQERYAFVVQGGRIIWEF